MIDRRPPALDEIPEESKGCGRSSFNELLEAVEDLCSHPSREPWIGNTSIGFVYIDGELNAEQLRLIADWLTTENDARRKVPEPKFASCHVQQRAAVGQK